MGNYLSCTFSRSLRIWRSIPDPAGIRRNGSYYLSACSAHFYHGKMRAAWVYSVWKLWNRPWYLFISSDGISCLCSDESMHVCMFENKKLFMASRDSSVFCTVSLTWRAGGIFYEGYNIYRYLCIDLHQGFEVDGESGRLLWFKERYYWVLHSAVLSILVQEQWNLHFNFYDSIPYYPAEKA